ncbi:MAG TPA: DegV family protein, partial [Rubrobacter sp.]|nr:DegV family protein [Rubrobacter sp.]
MTTAVVTDSTTSLAPGVLERPDVRVVPLTFHFGEDETYTDKVDMTNEEFYARLRDSDVFPTTAQPSPGAFVEAYTALSDYDDILVLTLSSKFSGTYDSAVSAAGMVERPVEVLDTRSAEMGSGLILLEALRVVDEGGDFKGVRRAAEAAIDRCNVLFGVGTLEYLAKSGR